jgi:hypothetical protein
MAKIIENESPMWITPLGRDETTSPNYHSAKSFRQASGSEAQASATAAIRRDKSSMGMRETLKRVLISLRQGILQVYKADSQARISLLPINTK